MSVMKLSLLLVLATMLSATALPPQEWRFDQLGTSGTRPPGRSDGVIAYDPVASELYLFGGTGASTYNDLWAYSITNDSWREISTQGEKPAPRLGHTLHYDPARRRLILFGGQASGFFNDVWSFDIAMQRWTRLANATGPNERYGHSAVLDAQTNRLIISHGFTDSGRFDDTWAFDLNTNLWTNLRPQGPLPLKRCLQHMVLDPATRIAYLFGGCASGFGPCPLNDLWALDLKTNRWTEIRSDPRPVARTHYGFAFSPTRSRALIFGGSGGGLLNDVWEYEPSTSRWLPLAVAGNRPSPRSRVQAEQIPELDATFFFGGSGTNELWRLSRAAQSPAGDLRSVVNAFSGQGGFVAPGEIVSLYGQHFASASSGAVFDSSGQLPRTLQGTSVLVNDIPAPLFYASPTQINAQIPYEVNSAQNVSIVVERDGVRTLPLQMPAAPAHPGIAVATDAAGRVIDQANPLRANGIFSIYLTGYGRTAPNAATGVRADPPLRVPLAETRLTLNDTPLELLFVGEAPGTVGVLQINARIAQPPSGLPSLRAYFGNVASAPFPLYVAP